MCLILDEESGMCKILRIGKQWPGFFLKVTRILSIRRKLNVRCKSNEYEIQNHHEMVQILENINFHLS